MEKYQFVCKKKSDLSESENLQIFKVKDEHWSHGLDSQRKWFNDNINDDDWNLCLYEDNKLVAYLHMVNVDVSVGGYLQSMYGIGNVCVTKTREHSGYGLRLMFQANAKIITDKKAGILLCKDKMIPFYNMCGWTEMRKILIAQEYINAIFYNKKLDDNITKIEVLRNF